MDKHSVSIKLKSMQKYATGVRCQIIWKQHELLPGVKRYCSVNFRLLAYSNLLHHISYPFKNIIRDHISKLYTYILSEISAFQSKSHRSVIIGVIEQVVSSVVLLSFV